MHYFYYICSEFKYILPLIITNPKIRNYHSIHD